MAPQPTYENARSIRHEQKALSVLQAAWDVTLHKQARLTFVDWFAIRDKYVIAAVEFKRRNLTSIDQYREIMLSLKKVQSAMTMCSEMEVPFVFVVKTNDGMYWWHRFKPDLSRYRIDRTSGRTRATRNDADVEPTVMIPWTWFVKVDDNPMFPKDRVETPALTPRLNTRGQPCATGSRGGGRLEGCQELPF